MPKALQIKGLNSQTTITIIENSALKCKEIRRFIARSFSRPSIETAQNAIYKYFTSKACSVLPVVSEFHTNIRCFTYIHQPDSLLMARGLGTKGGQIV